jgi:hypothetical protein
MTKNNLGPFDLLALPNLQRQIAARLLRQGPASAEVLAQSLDLALPEVRDALDELARQGAVLLTDESQARLSLGRTRCPPTGAIRPRRSPPCAPHFPSSSSPGPGWATLPTMVAATRCVSSRLRPNWAISWV